MPNASSAYVPNLQNNYYYNFNNTYVPQHAAAAAVGTDVSSGNTSANNQQKEVKSIEIQVSPERLVETAEVGAGGVVGKKRRKRRKRQAEVKQEEAHALPIKAEGSSSTFDWMRAGQYPYYPYSGPYYPPYGVPPP
jgi:hypothetical protein